MVLVNDVTTSFLAAFLQISTYTNFRSLLSISNKYLLPKRTFLIWVITFLYLHLTVKRSYEDLFLLFLRQHQQRPPRQRLDIMVRQLELWHQYLLDTQTPAELELLPQVLDHLRLLNIPILPLLVLQLLKIRFPLSQS